MASSAYAKLDRPVDSDDSENEHEVRTPRSSEDARRHDQETLHAEEEAERLLGGGSEKPSGPRQQARKKRRRRGNGEKGESELMYAMEEGGPPSGSSSGNSSEVDLQRLGAVQGRKKSRTPRFARFTLIHLVIIAAFLTLLFGAYQASKGSKTRTSKSAYTPQTLSNGTHVFAPTTLLISLDGFRADFLHRGLTPHLSAFARQGVSPKYMTPSFPSLTFPNHYTLVTGLYPESHGIVGNSFFDPDFAEEFDYGHPEHSMQPKWWQAEPLWVAAEKAGLKSAIHMWPGSEAGIGGEEGKPFAVDKFKQDEDLSVKVDRVLGWLDAEERQRPQFIAAYVPNVDSDGHLFGPNSTEIRSTITDVDIMLGDLFAGIEARNLTDIVNVVIVSDHGMATTSNNRLLQYEALIAPLTPEDIAHTDGWPLYGLRLKNETEVHLMEAYWVLRDKAEEETYRHAFDVYLRDLDMPPRYHFSKNDRIAPLWIVPKPGWAIVQRHEFDVASAASTGAVYHPRGLHGYDHEHPLMRAIFLARGPAFAAEGGSEVAAFQNTEVYGLVCESLGLERGNEKGNGTLTLPLEVLGMHDWEGWVVEDLPGTNEEEAVGAEALLPPVVPNLASPGPPHLPSIVQTEAEAASPTPSSSTGEVVEEPVVPERPIVHDGLDEEDEEGDKNLWAEWIKGKLDALREWASGVVGKIKGDGTEGEEDGDG